MLSDFLWVVQKSPHSSEVGMERKQSKYVLHYTCFSTGHSWADDGQYLDRKMNRLNKNTVLDFKLSPCFEYCV